MAGRKSTQAKPVCHIRQLKTGRMIYDYKRKTVNDTQAEVPWLQLKGHWLEQAGFGIDTAVTVRFRVGATLSGGAPHRSGHEL